MVKNKVLQWILFPFCIPADLLYLNGKSKEYIKADILRYKDEIPYDNAGVAALNYLMVINKPFRNIFYYRTRRSIFLRNISRLFLKPLATIEILGEIGKGFRISHNYAVIHPCKAGEDLFVGHGVTIGRGKANPDDHDRIYPIIGDHVSIYSNAVVFGGITIGNNVNIGAGAVVNKDVPDNCTVVENPMRIIRKV